MITFKKTAVVISIAIALSGCAGTHSPKIQSAIDRAEEQFEGGYEERVKAYRPVRNEIGKIYTGQAYHDVNNYALIEKDKRLLPEAFDDAAFIHQSGENGEKQFTVDEFAAMIYQAYGVIVDVSSPDLLVLDKSSVQDQPLRPGLPMNPNAGITGDATGEFEAINSLLPQTETATDRDNLKLKKFSYKGNLRGMLDYVAQLNGVKWKYDSDFQKAYLHAFDTKIFKVFDFGDETSMQSQITTTTSQDTESTSGGSNQQFTRKAQINTWDEISESIEALLSDSNGKATFNVKSGIINVTDSDYNLANIKRYVDELNKITTTEVVIEFRIIRFNYDDGNNNSINQNSLNAGLQNNLLGSFDMEFGMGNLSPSLTGNLGAFQELVQGNFLSIANDSHQFLMGFLNTVGTAEVAYETQVNVLNNDFFTDQEQETEEYIASIERQSSSGNGIGQDNITTERDVAVDGVSLTLKPRIIGDKIMVTYTIGSSDFIGLKDAGLGAGLEGVKLKTQGALNLGQTIPLINGIPKVIKFTQKSEESTNSQGMFDDLLWFLGGNESRSESRGAVIVTMTAYYNN
jgi:hypothetical protein